MFPDEAKGKAKAVETGIPGETTCASFPCLADRHSAHKGGTKIKIYTVSPPYF
jgi:hypothetical protein